MSDKNATMISLKDLQIALILRNFGAKDALKAHLNECRANQIEGEKKLRGVK